MEKTANKTPNFQIKAKNLQFVFELKKYPKF